LSIAVNLSARQFADEHLLQDVASILKTTDMEGPFREREAAHQRAHAPEHTAVAV
jgi:EAL domain-containing protein (putative c-di-GMP-specific phosphodiesterase class I)